MANLSGKHFLVLRPEGPAEILVNTLRHAEAKVSHHPMIKLVAHESPPLREMLDGIDQVDKAIFVSPSSVQFFMEHLKKAGLRLPNHTEYFAPGLSTAHALRTQGVTDIHHPKDVGDATSLLAMPEFLDIAGQRIYMIAGDSGSHQMIFEFLRRGADAHYVPCYRNLPGDPAGDAIREEHRQDPFSAIIVHSKTTLKNLLDQLGEHRRELFGTPVLTHHTAIQKLAESEGFARTHLAENGTAEAVIRLAEQVLG